MFSIPLSRSAEYWSSTSLSLNLLRISESMKMEGKKKPIIQPNGTIAVIILIHIADSLEPNQTAAILAGALAKQKAMPPIMDPRRVK